MGRTITAFPWGGSAFFAPPISGYGKRLKSLFLLDKSTHQRWIQSIAVLHLFGIEILTLRPDVLVLTLFFTVTGLVLILLLFYRNYITTNNTTEKNINLSGKERLDSSVQDLINRSKTFLDIAHSASRSRKHSEIGDEVWAELTARMSHELRTPLNAVLGFSDLMHAETFGPLGHDRYRDYLQHIKDCCRDLLKSTENTLALTSSLGKGCSKTTSNRINLFEIIKEISCHYEREILNRNIILKVLVSPSLEILTEKWHIQQILMNLFGEALNRVKTGNNIEIRTGTTQSQLTLTLTIISPKVVSRYDQSSLELCIARLLLKQKGSDLIYVEDENVWMVKIFLEKGCEKKFFNLVSYA